MPGIMQGFVAHLRHGIAWILFKLGEPWSKDVKSTCFKIEIGDLLRSKYDPNLEKYMPPNLLNISWTSCGIFSATLRSNPLSRGVGSPHVPPTCIACRVPFPVPEKKRNANIEERRCGAVSLPRISKVCEFFAILTEQQKTAREVVETAFYDPTWRMSSIYRLCLLTGIASGLRGSIYESSPKNKFWICQRKSLPAHPSPLVKTSTSFASMPKNWLSKSSISDCTRTDQVTTEKSDAEMGSIPPV